MITIKEVRIIAKEYGFNPSQQNVSRWLRGWYWGRNKVKVWYFKSHLRLPFNDSVNGKGYTFSKAAVVAFFKMLVDR